MAEGRNIEIKIAATGGDQAAAEVRKVDTAVDSLSGGGSSSGKGLKALAEETTKVTAANVKMGTGFQNVGYQVQDLAVQIGSGTSAFRALGQQLPQLLSGFGPLGITLGTVAAVALPLAGAMFNLGNAAEDAGEKADEAADKLKKLSDARTDKAIAAALKDSAAYLQSLDDENAAILRNNESIQRSINLLKAQQNAKVAIQNAQAALDLAALDADESKTDAEKIQGRAAINRRVERERFENERQQANFRVNAANNAARGATGDAERTSGDLQTAQGSLAAQQAERKDLAARVFAADAANKALPALDQRIADAKVIPFSDDPVAAAAARQESKAEVARIEAEKALLQAKVDGVSGDERKRLSELSGKDGKSGTIAQTQKAVEDLTAAAEKLAIVAAKAREDAEATQQVEGVGLESQFEVSKRRLAANTITANSGTVKAVKKDAADYLSEQQIDAKKDSTSAATRARALGSTARSAEGLIPKNVTDKFRKDFQTVSDGLQNGDQGGEVAKMLSMIEALANAVEKKGNDKDLSRRLDIMEQRIRNLGK